MTAAAQFASLVTRGGSATRIAELAKRQT
jgi:hypothetical protein